MASFKTLDQLDPAGKTVLLRADLNVPVQDGHVTDTTRLDRLAPTIQELSAKGAKVVLLSHFGRPKGKDASFSLNVVVSALEKSISKKVIFSADCIGDVAQQTVRSLKNGDVALLENVRFHPEEEKDDPAFAKQMASLGDIYINDAFSASHRAHASTHTLAKCLPAYAGRLMQAELDALQKALGAPVRPVVAIVGGAKISTKLDLLNNLVSKIDTLVLGGGMANTFLLAKGVAVGKSLCEKDLIETAKTIMATAEARNCRILLPADGIVAKEFKANPPLRNADVSTLQADEMILDIGPKTISEISGVLRTAKTVLWNGPVGAFETPPFENGTVTLAKEVANLTRQKQLISVAGGGDTVAALSMAGVEDAMTYVSTAGGAFLEWLEGKELPGVKALMG